MFTSSEISVRSNYYVFRYFIFLLVICTLASVYFESYLPYLLPVAILGIGIIFDDFRRLFYLIFAVLPFSIEFYFEGASIGTDLPSEPLMILLTGITIGTLMMRKLSIKLHYVTSPIFILMFLHLFWIFITSINSTNFLISTKLLAAKIWYIFPFFILPLMFIKDRIDIERAYKILYKFLLASIIIVLVRHALEGFSFAASYKVVQPFFRNHVNYAAISVICLPFVWAFYRINKLKQMSNKWMQFVLLIFIAGIYFSYTRAAILSMLIATGAWYIIKNRKVKTALAISSFIAIAGIIFLSWNNKYLDLEPNFERTITHTEFDNLIEATYKLEDISSMERVYRWMAGIEMIKDRFWFGFGPGTFYSNYKAYSISRFQTYVSDNPDQSGIHNYFLMTWVEQGIIGFMLLIALCFTILIEGERIFHICTDQRDGYIVMAATLGAIIIFAMCLINDLIETDKVGPFFFFNSAILLYFSWKYRPNLL
ncbi:MAG: O-antigen ligase family protein [Saprospiraceae bacterium]|nr:O-antigen ligase family protein [Saprospiraceae bacterium]